MAAAKKLRRRRLILPSQPRSLRRRLLRQAALEGEVPAVAVLLGLLLFLLIVTSVFVALLWNQLQVGWAAVHAAFGVGFLLFLGWGAAMGFALRMWPQPMLRRWNRWLGTGLLLLSLLGLAAALGGEATILGFPLQGTLGLLISGGTGLPEILRSLLPGAVGLALLFPRQAKRALRWTRGLFIATARRLYRAASRWRQQSEAASTAKELPPEAPTAEEATKSTVTMPRPAVPRKSRPPQAGEETDEEEEEPSSQLLETGTQPEQSKLASAPLVEGKVEVGEKLQKLPQKPWRLPSLEPLSVGSASEMDETALQERAASIEAVLAEYGIEAEVIEIRPGPAVTLFGLRPGWSRRYKEIRGKDAKGRPAVRREEVSRTRVKLDRIAALDRDLAMQLEVPSIRIFAPIPGTNLVGIEVPNPTPQTVHLRTILESDAFRRAQTKSKLVVPLGKGTGGEILTADLTKMPHLLIAGATGSGKSVFLNAFIASLLMNTTPSEVRMVLVDPKRVELPLFNHIPHLVAPVISDTNKVVNALGWLLAQMEERLEMLAKVQVRDLASFNRRRPEERMPYLVLVIDELADLMMTAGKRVEPMLCRLAQMGRAPGIHLVVATQRPSVDVVTGLIKANFPTRIAFAVTSQVDSRTILDTSGAEKLLG
ncbi:MAG: DNA translocase FtsK, partial [Chloroflexi bacterium]|nr:DNA translocase FtsK [Chloroflexota bacterium]